MIGFKNGAHRDGRDASLVADAVGEWRLEHAAVDRLLLLADLAGRAVDHVGAGRLEQARNRNCIVGRDPAFDPVMGRDAHADRLVLRPYCAHGSENFQRKAAAVFQRAAILIGAMIGQRRDETRQQVTVCAVQLQPVESGLGRLLCRLHEIGPDP